MAVSTEKAQKGLNDQTAKIIDAVLNLDFRTVPVAPMPMGNQSIRTMMSYCELCDNMKESLLMLRTCINLRESQDGIHILGSAVSDKLANLIQGGKHIKSLSFLLIITLKEKL